MNIFQRGEVYETLVYFSAIPLGVIGIFFPDTVNKIALEIPPEGLVQNSPVTPTNPAAIQNV